MSNWFNASIYRRRRQGNREDIRFKLFDDEDRPIDLVDLGFSPKIAWTKYPGGSVFEGNNGSTVPVEFENNWSYPEENDTFFEYISNGVRVIDGSKLFLVILSVRLNLKVPPNTNFSVRVNNKGYNLWGHDRVILSENQTFGQIVFLTTTVPPEDPSDYTDFTVVYAVFGDSPTAQIDISYIELSVVKLT